jgi:hypothetical protein
VAAGAYANPTDGALFLFKGAEPAEIEAFVKNDPCNDPRSDPCACRRRLGPCILRRRGEEEGGVSRRGRSGPADVVNGLVTAWEVKEWTAVVGSGVF